MSLTKATQKPVRRLVISGDKYGVDEYVVEVTERLLVLRPKGTKRGGPSEVVLGFGSLYLRGMMAKEEERRRAKKAARKAKRGGKK